MGIGLFTAVLLILGLLWLLKTAVSAASSRPQGHIAPAGAYDQECVGESNYQKALERIAGGRTEDGHELEVTATLVPEPDNPHDKQAIRVDVDDLTVGYLSRNDARRYRSRLKRSGLEVAPYSADALILGGWIRKKRGKPDVGSFGIALDLPSKITLKQ